MAAIRHKTLLLMLRMLPSFLSDSFVPGRVRPKKRFHAPNGKNYAKFFREKKELACLMENECVKKQVFCAFFRPGG